MNEVQETFTNVAVGSTGFAPHFEFLLDVGCNVPLEIVIVTFFVVEGCRLTVSPSAVGKFLPLAGSANVTLRFVSPKYWSYFFFSARSRELIRFTFLEKRQGFLFVNDVQAL